MHVKKNITVMHVMKVMQCIQVMISMKIIHFLQNVHIKLDIASMDILRSCLYYIKAKSDLMTNS